MTKTLNNVLFGWWSNLRCDLLVRAEGGDWAAEWLALAEVNKQLHSAMAQLDQEERKEDGRFTAGQAGFRQIRPQRRGNSPLKNP